MSNIYPILFAVLGAMLGSFSTMLIWRLHFDQTGIVTGRSRCPKCQKILSVFNLVPIFSWIFQGGKCTSCHEKISPFYPMVEIVFAFTFYLFSAKFFPTEVSDTKTIVNFVFLMLSVFLILILFFYDLKFLEVDRRISIPAIIIAIIWAFFRGNFAIYLIGGLVGFLFYFVQYWITKKILGKAGVGQGDFELGALMGLILGWKMLLGALFLAYIIGTIIALPILIFPKKLGAKIPRISGKLALPMGAFLMPSLLIFMYHGNEIMSWYWGFLLS